MVAQPSGVVKWSGGIVGRPSRIRPWRATVPHRLSPQGLNLGVRIFADINYEGDSTTLAPNDYAPDLTQFDAGLGVFGGDWTDKISSIQKGRCWSGVCVCPSATTHSLPHDW